MALSVNNSVNSLLTASFSDVRKTTALVNPKANGIEALNRVLTQVPAEQSAEIGNQPKRQNQAFSRFLEDRQPSLNDYVKPRNNLNPSDEVSLFALPAEAFSLASSIAGRPLSASDTNAIIARAEQASAKQPEEVVRKKQNYVANLYAQTNDITFSSDRIINQAA